MNKEKRESEYPIELESQFIMRLPEEPARILRELLQSGENFKNRLSIQLDPDMRHGEVRFDHWLLYGRIMDLPTIVESLKTIDRKSVYKTADISQIMVCKTEIDPKTEDESIKNKKKDTFKVDKKFLWPHGITPPTKNVRKRRFRKTLKKKNMEAPEIEREVKRLLRADNEAVSVTWEVVTEEDDYNLQPDATVSNKSKVKKEPKINKQLKNVNEGSNVEDIFGGALSESDIEEDSITVEVKDSKPPSGCKPLTSTNNTSTNTSVPINIKNTIPGQFTAEKFKVPGKKENELEDFVTKHTFDATKNIATHNVKQQQNLELQQVIIELEELKLRKQRTQHEIAGLENMTLRQRFQDILLTLNREIILKEKKYKNLQAHTN